MKKRTLRPLILIPALCATLAWAQDRQEAVQQVVASENACTQLSDFYWEIGDANGVLASGKSRRAGRINADTKLSIASGSKWVFAAYAAERERGNLSAGQVQMLQMRSGYDQLNPALCVREPTPESCFFANDNSKLNEADIGKFNYNGGHMQKLMLDLGLGSYDTGALSSDLQANLGGNIDIDYGSPQAAAGMRASATSYGEFLRRVLRRELIMGRILGARPVCTLPHSCPEALSSPAAPRAMHYSIGHWVEDDPRGDGAFSSAGAFGFYPWITADKRYYGIISRQESADSHTGFRSAECGMLMRRAFAGGDS
mgnify:CR=1 FL=1